MIDGSITELDTNMSFDVKVKSTPSKTQNYAIVYVDDKEVKRPTSTSVSGIVEFELDELPQSVEEFLAHWYRSRKRIDIMLEADEHMYFMKGCSIKTFDEVKKVFTVFYNSFRES